MRSVRPGYVAPELIKACKGTTYADCPGPTFTEETDNFSLAIHCFRMLMNGCHPFICQRQLKRAGSAPAPKSTDKRIECGETPFSRAFPIIRRLAMRRISMPSLRTFGICLGERSLMVTAIPRPDRLLQSGKKLCCALEMK